MIGVSLIEQDPELFAGLSESALEDAREAIVPAWQVDEGTWHPPVIDPHRVPFGLLLLDGFLACDTVLPESRSVDLLGPGDVLRPWVAPGEESADVDVEWEALESCVIAALDVRFASVALRHPGIITTLLDREVAHASWMALHLAICHIVGLDKRLESMLWHLSERWGRVSKDGVILPLRFSHEFLAKLVGVRRPSVTSAISRLRQEGVLERRSDGSWLLHRRPAPPVTVLDEVAELATD
jgi:CRP/FNR family transcriptional regulator, cyclic AMP receptor protein